MIARDSGGLLIALTNDAPLRKMHLSPENDIGICNQRRYIWLQPSREPHYLCRRGCLAQRYGSSGACNFMRGGETSAMRGVEVPWDDNEPPAPPSGCCTSSSGKLVTTCSFRHVRGWWYNADLSTFTVKSGNLEGKIIRPIHLTFFGSSKEFH